MAVAGIDLGTSAVKAIVVGDDGAVLGLDSADCQVSVTRPGWVEARPADWLRAASIALGRALTTGGRDPVRAIGLAGQMHGVVLCERDGRACRPALLWPDRRAHDVLERWTALSDSRRAALSNPLVPGMAGPMLAWLGREERHTLKSAAWALQAKDWFRLVLTGTASTEPTDASATLLWDLPADRWADDIASAVGVDPSLLPPVLRSDEPVGGLTARGAEVLGLPVGIPVYSGAADTAAALLGSGVGAPGDRVLNLGTGAQLVTLVDRPDARRWPTTHRYRAASRGWYAMAAVQNAGLALEWARKLFGGSWRETERQAFEDIGEDEELPLFVPHLTGERTPLLDPQARGAWVGLAIEHGPGHLLRAAYNGVAHSIRYAREALEAEGAAGSGALRLLGGGSLRVHYRNVLADTLGEPLELLELADATALGAVRLAGADLPAPRTTTIVEPDERRAERAAARHERWRAAIDGLALVRERPARPGRGGYGAHEHGELNT